jgi:hypothetical protein
MLHHCFRKGTHILVIFKSGKALDCKFLDAKANSIITDKGEFNFKDIRATTIFKWNSNAPK